MDKKEVYVSPAALAFPVDAEINVCCISGGKTEPGGKGDGGDGGEEIDPDF